MYLKAQNLQAAYYTAGLQLEYNWMKTFLVALYGLCIKVHLNEVNAIICKKQGLKSISTIYGGIFLEKEIKDKFGVYVIYINYL